MAQCRRRERSVDARERSVDDAAIDDIVSGRPAEEYAVGQQRSGVENQGHAAPSVPLTRREPRRAREINPSISPLSGVRRDRSMVRILGDRQIVRHQTSPSHGPAAGVLAATAAKVQEDKED